MGDKREISFPLFLLINKIFAYILYMPRIATPEVLHPTLQFRYEIFWTKLPGAILYARNLDLPSLTQPSINAYHQNGIMKTKGRTTWNDITMKLYTFEFITARELWTYINNSHQIVADAQDKNPADYKSDIMITVLSPVGAPVNIWQVKDAFITEVSWGNLDWGQESILECDITVSYDWAEKIL